ncbi:hypothetical protein BJ138DRAFT_1147950 [Hygrophoropsis aurantiaca]|uniref:Uncharacterized protein n=1 Tax=Hygrophoropsis aurantiaca TaxID=72124 RepID=A0ACB8AHD5_9AGAM|nr:hypothetical protein BJ138DRAFT_1147950 [Hygrophoropsis aurantiaca]
MSPNTPENIAYMTHSLYDTFAAGQTGSTSSPPCHPTLSTSPPPSNVPEVRTKCRGKTYVCYSNSATASLTDSRQSSSTLGAKTSPRNLRSSGDTSSIAPGTGQAISLSFPITSATNNVGYLQHTETDSASVSASTHSDTESNTDTFTGSNVGSSSSSTYSPTSSTNTWSNSNTYSESASQITTFSDSHPSVTHSADPTSFIVRTSSSYLAGSSTTKEYTSTVVFTFTSTYSGQTYATTVLSTAVLSTQGVIQQQRGLSQSPGSIAGITLGVFGTLLFATLWIFCTRRRQRRLNALVHEAAEMRFSGTTERGPLDTEIDGAGVVAPRAMEERYAGLLLALNSDSFQGAHHSRQFNEDIPRQGQEDARGSSPTLPIHSLPPPPPFYLPPPSAYIPPEYHGGRARRQTSPGPDAGAWLGGHSISHSSGSNSQTSYPSDEPLLVGRIGSTSSHTHGHTYSTGLGSAFGSPETSLHGHSVLQSASSHGALLRPSSFGSSNMEPYSSSSHGASSHGLRSISSHGVLNAASFITFGIDKKRSRMSDTPTSPRGKPSRISHSSSSVRGSERGSPGRNGESVDERSVGSVRAFLGRLRGGRMSPSGTVTSDRNIQSISDVNFPPVVPNMPHEAYPGSALETQSENSRENSRRRTRRSFVLSNPDPQPQSPYPLDNISDHQAEASFIPNTALDPTTTRCPSPWPWLPYSNNLNMSMPSNAWPMPSPAFTEDSRPAEGLLHPRLRENEREPGEGGRSVASLRDFEDYSRPISGLINNRMYSTTTFTTEDTQRGVVASSHGSFVDPEEHSDSANI